MTHSNFYQKYRPQVFADIVEQKETVAILKNVVRCQKVHHAYLFTGMQGVGKTSTARIFAQAINCLNNQSGELCQTCQTCQTNQTALTDIIEIDAASHNGVEEIRNLKANAMIKPIMANYKVYIIDEVHMLSKNAFNAFLKLLEEPPRHVVFILATTELTKIPETILSRCQLFYFASITIAGLTTFLTEVAKKESLTVDPVAMQVIATHSQGLVRDALNLLEQIGVADVNSKITLTRVHQHLGLINNNLKHTFFQLLLQNRKKEVLTMIQNFVRQNVNLQSLTETLMTFTKDLIIASTNESLSGHKNTISSCLPVDTLETMLDIFLEYHSYFQLRLQKQLFFEIMCMKILRLLTKTAFNPKLSLTNNAPFNSRECRVSLQTNLNLLKARQPQLFTQLKKQ